MGKPGAVRQKECESRQRDKNLEEFLHKQREKKRKQRLCLKMDKKKYEAAKEKGKIT